MDYKTLMEIPEEIREFYSEEIRTEQVFEEDGITPVLVDEEYTYIDENMEEQTGIKKVATYSDNTYIVENTRYDLKSEEDVKTVVINSKGRNDTVVNYFIEKYLEAKKFEFLDNYKEYETKLAEAIEDRDNYVEIEDVETPNFEEIILNIESTKPVKPTDTLDSYRLKNGRFIRKYTYPDWNDQFEDLYDNELYWELSIEAIKMAIPVE